jgi:hypothetical protein
MKPAPALRVAVVALLCASALVGLVLSENAAREQGQEVLLPIEAVDPRSLLSGHYVALGLTQTLPPGAPCPEVADWRWIALRPAGEAYTLVGGAMSRDQAQQSGLPVRGSFLCVPPAAPSERGWVQLDIGIERYHANQREAERIERALREATSATPAYAIVSIGTDGRARLKGLMVGAQRLDLTFF